MSDTGDVTPRAPEEEEEPDDGAVAEAPVAEEVTEAEEPTDGEGVAAEAPVAEEVTEEVHDEGAAPQVPAAKEPHAAPLEKKQRRASLTKAKKEEPVAKELVRVGIAPQLPMTKEQHREWVQRLWSRLDRDHSDEITKEELNCDEFQQVLRSIMAPSTIGKSVATYGRAEVNLKAALNYCAAKADTNNDGVLSFKEFEAFLRFLRNETSPEHVTDVIFALFDLDNTQKLTQSEFRGVYRYFLGNDPMAADLQEAWQQLDPDGNRFTTKKDFAIWLDKQAKPVFRQHAPPVIGSPASSASGGSVRMKKRHKSSPVIHRHAPGICPPRSVKKQGAPDATPEWNNRFNSEGDPSEQNLAWKGNLRAKQYFMREQSLPELCRFYNTFQGFSDHRRRLLQEDLPRPSQWPPIRVAPPGASRHVPGGSMRDSRGNVVPWAEQTPRALIRPVWAPGSMLLRSPAKPSKFLLHGRDADE